MHAHVLGITYVELPLCDSPKPDPVPGSAPSNGHMRPSPTIMTLNELLTDILEPTPHRNIHGAIETILSTLWPRSFTNTQHEPKLDIYFDDVPYRGAVGAQLLWNYPSTDRPTPASARSAELPIVAVSGSTADPFRGKPMLCYIAKDQIGSLRDNVLYVAPHPTRDRNEPVNRLQRLVTNRLLPSDPNKDVYIAGILLGMAQRHFYRTLPPPSADTRSQLRRLQFADLDLRVLTHDLEAAEFIVYTGHVTSKFLARFHNPREVYGNKSAIAGLQIRYARVPIWPLLGLRERLGKALGEDVVGTFDPDKMETWENNVTGAEQPIRSGSKGCSKRKWHSTSTTVFNYTGSADGQCAGRYAKRRCRLHHGQ